MLPLTPRSRKLHDADANGAGGIRTPTVRIKSPPCLAVTPQPRCGTKAAFSPNLLVHRLASLPCNVLVMTSHPEAGPAAGHSPCLTPKSGWPDSNQRLRGPKPRGVPLPYTPPCTPQMTHEGFEPCLSGLKDRRSHQKSNEPTCLADLRHQPQARRHQWAKRCSNPSLPVFSRALCHLSYRPETEGHAPPPKRP